MAACLIWLYTTGSGTNIMFSNYFPVFIFMLVGLAAGVLFIALGLLLGPNRHYAEKTRLSSAASRRLKTRA